MSKVTPRLWSGMNIISFYPDYTVGPGVTPDLLTLHFWKRSRAIPPVGNYTPP